MRFPRKALAKVDFRRLLGYDLGSVWTMRRLLLVLVLLLLLLVVAVAALKAAQLTLM